MVSGRYAICLLALFVLAAHGEDENEAKSENSDDVRFEEYLKQYRYLPRSHRAGGPQAKAAKTRAIQSFQKFAHLPVTGELDTETKAKMAAPRCGMPDVKPKNQRASFSSIWDKAVLTWKLVKGTSQISDDQVKKAIRDSFAVWNKIIPMNFTEVSQDAKADMQFNFHTLDHGDGFKFDGPGNVLAHAFYPKDGRLHFDDDEKWTFEDASQIKDGGYTDLLSVTIHELGHSLGLAHLSEEDAIMYPFYRHPDLDENGRIKPFVLSQFDIKAIQEAYGSREDAIPDPIPPGGPSTGAACPAFQSVVTAGDGATYFFNDNIGWKKDDGVQGAPNSGTRFYLNLRFPNGPTKVTAAFADKGSSITYLFQDRRVWAYRYRAGTQKFFLDSSFPKDLQDDVPFTPLGGFQLMQGHLILYGPTDFIIWSPHDNKATYQSSLNGFFGSFPSGKSFNYGEAGNNVYFVGQNGYTVFDTEARKEVSTAPLKQLITC